MKVINKSINSIFALMLVSTMLFNVTFAKNLEYTKEDNGTIKFSVSKIETVYSEKVPFSIEVAYADKPSLRFVANGNIEVGKDFNIEPKDNGIKVTGKERSSSIGTFYILTPIFTKINAENVKGFINSNNMDVKDFAVGLSGESELGVYNGSYKKLNVETSGKSLLHIQYINTDDDVVFATSGESEFKASDLTVGKKFSITTSGKSTGDIDKVNVNNDLKFETSGSSLINLNDADVNGDIKASTSGSSQLTIHGKHQNGLDIDTSGSSIINIQ